MTGLPRSRFGPFISVLVMALAVLALAGVSLLALHLAVLVAAFFAGIA